MEIEGESLHGAVVRLHDGQLIAPLAKHSGGCGKADRAQVGGKDPAKLPKALSLVGIGGFAAFALYLPFVRIY